MSKELELTEWMPCTINPIRDGWYDVFRSGTALGTERVRFCHGHWDYIASASRMPVWISKDCWRGVSGRYYSSFMFEASKEG